MKGGAHTKKKNSSLHFFFKFSQQTLTEVNFVCIYLANLVSVTNSDNSVLFLNTIKLESKWTKVFKIFPLPSFNFCENKTLTICNNLPLFNYIFRF